MGLMKKDSVDQTLREWAEHAPDLDVSGRQIVWRLQLVTKYIADAVEEMDPLEEQLSSSGVRMLLHLIGMRPPHEASPTALSKRILLTSGSMTALTDRLEAVGYVTRRPDPNDRRGVLIRLTDDGVEAALRLRGAYDELEERILAPLDDGQRATLTGLLRSLISTYESEGWSIPKG